MTYKSLSSVYRKMLSESKPAEIETPKDINHKEDDNIQKDTTNRMVDNVHHYIARSMKAQHKTKIIDNA